MGHTSEGDQLYERRKYRRPPITEAICEFRLASGTDRWNPALPGLLYERIREDYPETPTQQISAGIDVEPQEEQAKVTFRTPVAAVELADTDGHHVVTLAPNVLTVRVRGEPYPGWEVFHSRIRKVLEHYAVLSPAAAVQRVGMRYINRVVIPSMAVEIPEYFNAAPVTPDGFPDQLVGIFARFESHYADEDDERDVRLLYTFASTPEEGASAFILDIDVIEIWAQDPVPLVDVGVLTDLKRRETAVFEAIITDRVRELIDAD